MKRNGIELLKMILSIILFSGAVLLVGFQVFQYRKTAENAPIKQENRLDIAVVNEDQGGQLDGKSYKIGESYIKHLEKDTSNNWTVVPRSLAEDGLDSGKYQLVIYIPSNFSKKVVDINAVVPEKATVTYKVNAQGNATVENMANQVGNRIVTDLDQRLVSVFMASILDHLYQAQQNLQSIVDTQEGNIGTYQNSILEATVNFRDSLPNLLDAARLSGGSNDQLLASLVDSTGHYDNLESSQSEYGENLSALLEQRAAGDVSYGEFIEELFVMDNLPEESQSLYSQIEANQAKLQDSIAKEDDPETTDIDETGGLKHSLSVQRNLIKERIEEIKKSVKADMAEYYDIPEEEVEKITLGQFLEKNIGSFEIDDLKTQLETAKETLDKEEQGFTDTIHSFFEIDNSLGKFNNATVNISSNRPNLTILGIKMNGVDTSTAPLDKGINKVEFSYTISGKPDVDQGGADIVVTVTQNGEVAPSQGPAQQQTSSDSSNATVVNSTNDTPASTQVQGGQNQSQPEPNQPNTTNPGDNNQAPAQPNNNVAVVGSTGQGMTFYIDADYSNFYHRQSYQDALTQYNHLQGQVKYLEKPIGKYLEHQITNVLNKSMTGVGDSVDQSMDLLNAEVTQIEKEASVVSNDIATLLERYGTLSEQVTTVQTAQEADQSSQGEVGSAITDLAPSFESLASDSASAQTTSESMVSVAEAARGNLANFEEIVARTETMTNGLATNADSLSQSFSDELAKNQDYVTSFVKVLNNAYNDGVPNEVLLDFLSNPVKEEAVATRTTTNVFKPFTWVLLIAMSSIFTAYVFSNSRVFQPTLNKYSQNKKFHLSANSKTIIVSQLLMLLIGLAIGMVSLERLSIPRADSGLWVFSVVVMSMFLSQWIYLGLKYWKSIGMALTLFVFGTYIFLTSAVGTTATLSGFPLVLKNMNILSLFEGILAGFMVKAPLVFLQMFILVLGLAVGLALGIVLKPKIMKEN